MIVGSRRVACAALVAVVVAVCCAGSVVGAGSCKSPAGYNANAFANGGKGYLVEESQYDYYIAVCEELSKSECTDSGPISVCQTWGTSSGEQKVLAGDEYEVTELKSKDGLTIVQKGSSKSTCLPDGNYVQMDIECDATKTGTLSLSYSGYSACKYTFTGKSALACPGGGGGGAAPKKKGLSIGSILLIVALVCTVVYLAAGMAWQYRKGERGIVALLPNKGFWSSLPGLIKEGCTFTYSAIRSKIGGDNYSNIP